jgi:uncharacterized membrane protein
MSTTTLNQSFFLPRTTIGVRRRIESIDILRGVVMVIMALDHVRDYFHAPAFVYSPTDLSHTDLMQFSKRWITQFSAPVCAFRAGTSACLYGYKKTKKELSFFLFSRGLWLVFIEIFILTLARTFNPAFHFINLQVIWAIGISMMVLSGLIFLDRRIVLLAGIALIAGHNLLDHVHVQSPFLPSFLWSLLHETGFFSIGDIRIHVHYPLLPWIGIICAGYGAGQLFEKGFPSEMRKRILLLTGSGAILLFILLRSGNFYGDPSHWAVQKNALFSFLSFINVSKYPPSLLYTLVTLGPALIFLGIAESPGIKWPSTFSMFGRVPLFYYIAHIFLIHVMALLAAVISGYHWSDMVLSDMVNSSPQLKGYGFNLLVVYLVWITLLFILYPFCSWFDQYKRKHQSREPWLRYM